MLTSGVDVERDPLGRGLSLVAARAFAPGEVLLDEPPRFLLVEADDGVDDELLAATCAATGQSAAHELPRTLAAALALWVRLPHAERCAMAELFCKPDDPGLAELCASIAAEVRTRVPRLSHVGEDAGVPPLGDALLVWLLSSHTTACVESGNEGAALFALGHRCNHSCAPNAAYVPAGAHRLRLRALVPIRAGEHIFTSYLRSHELLAPCHVRRALLSARKCFRCVCARCAAADDAEPELSLIHI